MTTQDQGKGQQQLPREAMADQVFSAIIEAMCTDNCSHFLVIQGDAADALPHIALLIDAGYFSQDVSTAQADLDSDVWMAAAGEETEAQEHFSRLPAAYAALSEVLNRIFDRPLDDSPLNRYRIVQDGRHVGDIEAVDARVAATRAVETYGCGVFDVSLIRGTDDSVEWEADQC